MKLILRQATIIDPGSPHNATTQDILIDDGTVTQIASSLHVSFDEEIAVGGLHISPGWIDPFANFCDPGYEFKESLESGAQAAAAGGFTTVMVIPNTKPVIDTKSQVEYILQKNRGLAADVLPIGAITRQAEGKELSEMYDMQHSGAIAFSDGTNPVQASGILVKALQYVKSFKGTVIQLPDDKNLAPHGLMNEGITSTQLGLAGKPIIAEELMVDRDIKLAAYTRSRIHFTGVTSENSLEYIRRAKVAGLQVSCSVTPYHLFFCDEDLHDYDTNLKVNPPLRSRQQMMALRKALTDGTVDCIASHHQPHEFDSKVVEFEYAKFGMTGLESAYAVVQTLFQELPAHRIVELFSTNAARIFGLPISNVVTQSLANYTLYLPCQTFTFAENMIRSKSKNSPFPGKEFTGRVVGTMIGSRLTMNLYN